MKLDRNSNPDGHGKYALVKLRVVNSAPPAKRHEIEDALKVLGDFGCLDYGSTPNTSFFVIKLHDPCAEAALEAYADEAQYKLDPEFAVEVENLATLAATLDPHYPTPI